MKLTRNFNSEEFKCKDGTSVPLKLLPKVQELAENLQILRDYFGKPIIINSGYRSLRHNKKVGGAPSSKHLNAEAADIRVEGLSPKQVHTAILSLIKEGKIHNGGLGLYNTFVHYDIRKTPARWDLRT